MKPDYTHAKSILTALEEGREIQVFSHGRWQRSSINDVLNYFDIVEINKSAFYRIKPTPKRVPLEMGDFPPVCWLRETVRPNHNSLAGYYTPTAVNCRFWGDISYSDLSNAYEYSSDRVNWKPCWKEIEG